MDSQSSVRPLTLPVLVFGIVEVRRLRRELEALDEYIRQAAIRQPDTQGALPRVSRLLDALATDNDRNLLQTADRDELKAFLAEVAQSAPTIHISFASDPSSSFTAKLVSWLRSSIHPSILLQIGLQPSIAAGCVVRTTNKTFDLSLRQKLTEQRPLLLQTLEADRAAHTPKSMPTPQPETAP